MSKLVVKSFSISIDGFGAGPLQSLENPLGMGGMDLHKWVFDTKSFKSMHGDGTGGAEGIDNDFVTKGFENLGAWILGRNMFGPIRGPWLDEEWKGWWGPNPPYHVPVFVLTHHPRPSIVMEGGTVFHFVTDGIESALVHAKQAAGGKDIRLGGGVSTIKQYLKKRLIDEIHLAQSPVLLGSGENLFSDVNWGELGYQLESHVSSLLTNHLVIKKIDL
ncbi:dihydrofolate reductase [Leptospira ognonensis]|uniref:Dihydrofolate reductase n=1 Tax=Leptospira ognonensis TaxID=2484945 RepID=A0A4R9K2B2_9LEPT|nr:dihydrofolate reductase family protein [Leptospira ognonensis]TGL59311.1 dihydrofolate reductase [Leptospira ognonensis]